MKGTVNWYNERAGYGFITGEDGVDVFVYRNAIHFLTFLDAGDKVEYQLENVEKGQRAINLKLV